MRVVTSDACLPHDPGPGHPEAPVRLRTVLAALEAAGHAPTRAAPASADFPATVHHPSYLRALEGMSVRGHGDYGPDSPVGPATWSAALAATGACQAALESALSGAGHAFAAIRPPGHHALHDQAMGFCYLNHVVLLADAARGRGIARALIVDWDVHHGNGTQALVERDPAIRFVSMHQWPWYPGTGAAVERGVGNCFNVPMAANRPAPEYVEALWNAVVAATAGWDPELVLLSAGYDGMRGDPLGGFTLEPADYATWIVRLRERFPAVPIVGLMEGGYIPARLAAGVVATVAALA